MQTATDVLTPSALPAPTTPPPEPSQTIAALDALDRAILIELAQWETAHPSAKLRSGPTWRELRALLGLPPPPPLAPGMARQAAVLSRTEGVGYQQALTRLGHGGDDETGRELKRRIRRLADGGWVVSTLKARSLRIGPTTLAAFRAARNGGQGDA